MLYIARHGQTEWNAEKRWGGWTDIPLNGKGAAQAVELGHKIKDIKFDVAFISPLMRARQTCEIALSFMPPKNRPQVITDGRLMEIYCGDYEGFQSKDDETGIREYKWIFSSPRPDDLIEYTRDHTTVEDPLGFEARINDFFSDLTKNYKGKNVFIVCHGGVMLFAEAYFNGRPEDGNFWKASYVKNCEIRTFEL